MTTRADAAVAPAVAHLGPRYKWIALTNTTLGVLIVTINMSILLIALPDIFRGIALDPLRPENISYLLWLIMGYLVVTAVLVVTFGRVGDMFGRTRMYTLGFAVFTVFSILLAVTWLKGDAGAIWLISMRVLQGIGGALLLANSTAILTDAFPTHQRGLALGINSIAAIAGSFLGLIIGGVLAPVAWHLVFIVSVPIGVGGTIWAWSRLKETSERHEGRIDWWGNVTFAVGLVAVLMGITYGIQPYGGHVMGWTSPTVLVCLIGGVVVLAVFVVIERRVPHPMFHLSLFGIRSFTAGNIANLLSALGRGGLQFILIIWLQGIWLPRHGYDYESTPLWAGIYMVPLTIGFLIAGPLSGVLSDRHGARWYAAGGMLVAAVSFLLHGVPAGRLPVLPVRDPARGQRARDGPVLVAEPRLDHEQRPRPPARRGRGHDGDVPERRHRPLDRHLLLDADPGPRLDAARGAVQRADRAGRARRRRGPHRRAPAGEHPVRRPARLQPDRDAARPRRAVPGGAAAGGVPHRSQLLPGADLRPLRRRPVPGARLRRGLLPRRRDRVAVRQREAVGAGGRVAPARRWGRRTGADLEARPVAVAGRILAPDEAPAAAVLTLVDAHGHEADRAETDDEGRFALSAGGRSGEYLVIATPRGRGAAAPAATRVTVNGSPVHVDVVLRERAAVR